MNFYPDGSNMFQTNHAAVDLELVSNNAEVPASFSLILVNQSAGTRRPVCNPSIVRVFHSGTRYGDTILRRQLEAGYVVDDCLTIECIILIRKEPKVETMTDFEIEVETRGSFEVEVPPSDLSEHFGKLFLSEEGADVTFSVGGEILPAHKIIIAAWSPVFKAQMYGQMKERRDQCVTVEEMQPDVFKALLQFIYTDSLPDWDDLDAEEHCEIVRHLLVASDRYAMDRLKLLCASILVEYLDAENVATTLAIADQHNCDRLKDVCIEFMASSDEMDAVVKTEGYANLKRTCPSILLDVLEKSCKYRKT